MLAYLPDVHPEPDLRRLTEFTICDPDELTRHLRAVMLDGFAHECQESRIGRAALAVPLRDRADHVVGGLYLHGADGRVQPDRELIRFPRRRRRRTHRDGVIQPSAVTKPRSTSHCLATVAGSSPSTSTCLLSSLITSSVSTAEMGAITSRDLRVPLGEVLAHRQRRVVLREELTVVLEHHEIEGRDPAVVW